MSRFLYKLNKHDKGWQDLMKDQLYTAVLGSIIYLVFEWFHTAWEHKTAITLWEFIYRSLLLLLCVVFYLSDYYYIKYSKPYRKWHFALDIIFMFCMFYAVKSLGLEFVERKGFTLNTPAALLSEFKLAWVNYSFTTFFILYLGWDLIELKLTKSEKTDEKLYYIEVISWELLSIIALLVNNFIRSEMLLLFTLLISTFWFTGIALRKKCHMPCRQLKYFKRLSKNV